jgi:lysozyme
VKISDRGLALIERFEGFREDAYPDPGTGGNPWTIGIGTTKYPDGHRVRQGDHITHEQDREYLLHDLAWVEECIDHCVQVELTQNQRDATASLIYNLGCRAFEKSTLLRRLNAGRYEEAAEEFPKWCHAGGHVLRGLVKRRLEEHDLFLT